MNASDLVKESFEWLKSNYTSFTFFAERDVVWTIQTYLIKRIKEENLSYKVFNDYPIKKGTGRSFSADIVIVNDEQVEVAVEFKYEPKHERIDIDPAKLKNTVVFWGDDGVAKDIKRVKEFVAEGRAKKACAIFIDEGRLFKDKQNREPHPGSYWEDWGEEAALIAWAG